MQTVTMETYKESLPRLKAEFLQALKPGAIVYQSWGYDQTNIDFYKVIERKGSKVTLIEIGCQTVENSQGRDCDRVLADPDTTIGAPFSKIVRSPWIRMTSYSSLRLWDGKELYRSWYA